MLRDAHRIFPGSNFYNGDTAQGKAQWSLLSRLYLPQVRSIAFRSLARPISSVVVYSRVTGRPENTSRRATSRISNLRGRKSRKRTYRKTGEFMSAVKKEGTHEEGGSGIEREKKRGRGKERESKWTAAARNVDYLESTWARSKLSLNKRDPPFLDVITRPPPSDSSLMKVPSRCHVRVQRTRVSVYVLSMSSMSSWRSRRRMKRDVEVITPAIYNLSNWFTSQYLVEKSWTRANVTRSNQIWQVLKT